MEMDGTNQNAVARQGRLGAVLQVAESGLTLVVRSPGAIAAQPGGTTGRTGGLTLGEHLFCNAEMEQRRARLKDRHAQPLPLTGQPTELALSHQRAVTASQVRGRECPGVHPKQRRDSHHRGPVTPDADRLWTRSLVPSSETRHTTERDVGFRYGREKSVLSPGSQPAAHPLRDQQPADDSPQAHVERALFLERQLGPLVGSAHLDAETVRRPARTRTCIEASYHKCVQMMKDRSG